MESAAKSEWLPGKVLAELIESGMNTIRCNMSHGDHADPPIRRSLFFSLRGCASLQSRFGPPRF